MLSLQQLLTPAELADINAKLDAATRVDGRETAHGATRLTRNNRRFGVEDPLALELGGIVRAALLRERDPGNEDLIKLNVTYQNFARLFCG